MTSRRAIVCTSNSHKLGELQELLPSLQLEVLPSGIELPEETEETFLGNARLKAVGGRRSLASHGITNVWVIADDSGLEVEVLDGAPGVRSSRFAGADATDELNNELLLDQLADHPDVDSRSARFCCVLVAIAPDGTEFTSEGHVDGHIATAPVGAAGFGYDPLFVPTGEDHTFAELGSAAKQQMSHRARAAAALARQLAAHLAPALRNEAADTRSQLRRKQRAVGFSLASSSILTVAKVVVAVMTGSVAVLSEAVHSLTDLVAASIALIAIRRAHHPPDSRHRYGHGRVENLSSLAEGLIILVTVGWVAYQSVSNIIAGASVHTPSLAAGVMVVSAISSLLVARYLYRVGRETNSPAVSADGAHLMADVYTSLGAALGLLLLTVTGLAWIDGVTALAISAVVVRMGVRMVVAALHVLLDEALPEDEVRRIERVLVEQFTDVARFHRLRTRRSGGRRHVDLHLTLDGTLSLDAAHEIAMQVEEAIARELPNTDVLTHLEPHSVAPSPGEDIGPDDQA